MLYSIFAKLFGQDPFENRYTPRPFHVIYSLLITGAGIRIIAIDGLMIFGVIVSITGTLLVITIILGMNWDKAIEYWYQINEHIRLMSKVKDPDIWQAMGYKHPPESIEITETINNGQGFTTSKIKTDKISPAVMNQVANKVFLSNTLDLSEEVYGSLIPHFRDWRKKWIDEGKLVRKIKNNPRGGYTLSRKGTLAMYEYASDFVKEKVKL